MAYLSLSLFLIIALTRLALYQMGDWFRPASAIRARTTLQRWARWACRWWGLRIDVTGALMDGPCIYVANHRTYLDIAVLAGILPAAFLSRADVASWPLVSTIARKTETLLVARDDVSDRRRAARRLLDRVKSTSFIVFPEGTTTGGRLPAPFRSGVFRLGRWRAVPLVPVTIRYSDRRAYWVDESPFGRHLIQHVLGGSPLRVQVHLGTPLFATDFASTDEYCAAVYTAVCRPIEMHGELA